MNTEQVYDRAREAATSLGLTLRAASAHPKKTQSLSSPHEQLEPQKQQTKRHPLFQPLEAEKRWHRLARVFFGRIAPFRLLYLSQTEGFLRPNAGRPGAERQWTACNKHPRLPHSYSLQCLGFSPHDSHPQTRHPASFCKKEPHTRTSAEGATTVRIMANSLTKSQ